MNSFRGLVIQFGGSLKTGHVRRPPKTVARDTAHVYISYRIPLRHSGCTLTNWRSQRDHTSKLSVFQLTGQIFLARACWVVAAVLL